MAIILFTAPAPNPGDFWCTPPSDLPENYKADWIANAHPVRQDNHNNLKINFCEVYSEIFNNPLNYLGKNDTKLNTTNFTARKCQNFTFHPDYHSLVADFGLVCGRQLLVPLSQCFHIFGLLVGGILAYYLLKL